MEADAHRLELGDALVDALLGARQQRRDVGSDGLVGAIEVDAGEALDLPDGEPDRTESGDDLRAPHGRLVEQAVVAAVWPTV